MFTGSPWPSTDSLSGLWLFASTQYPLDSARVVEGVLIEPRFIFLYPSLSESLPFDVARVEFTFELVPGTYTYVGVIQQLRPELLVSNFRVVGVLPNLTNPLLPRTISIGAHTVIEGLSISVDFNNPPVQPFQ